MRLFALAVTLSLTASAAVSAGATSLVVPPSGIRGIVSERVAVVPIRHVRDAVTWALKGAEVAEHAL